MSLKIAVMGLCALLSLQTAWAQTRPADAGLSFTDGGEIVGPSGKVSVGHSGGITITTATGDIYSLTIPTAVRGGKTLWNGGGLADKRLDVDTATKQTTFSAKLDDKALAAPIPVRFGIALSPEGKARISLRYDSTEPIAKLLTMSNVFFYIQRSEAIGSQVTVNGTSTPIEAGPATKQVVNLKSATDPRDVEFFSTDPLRTVKVHVVQAKDVSVRDENLSQWQSLGMRFGPVDNQIVFDVDLPPTAAPKSAETYAGVDFYAAEKIRMPQYNLSRNLVQNPSFEQGFQYWNFGNLGSVKTSRYPDNYLIEKSAQCHSGNKCLKILGEKGESPALLATFAIPVEAGKTYTLSFHAKADRPKQQLMTSVFPSSFSNGLSWKGFDITQDWQRYSYSFKAPSGALSVQFGISNPAEDSTGLLDDIQLEQGALTVATRKPTELALVTDHRDNLFKPGEPMNARWEISGAPGAQGTLAVTLRDFFGADLSKHSAPFTIGADGTTAVAQPWLHGLDKGIYTQEATATMATGFSVREFGRLTVAPPADLTVKHHKLFAMGGVQTRQGSWDRRLATLAYYGIGSAMNFDPIPHGHLALMAKHHITNVTSIFDSGDHFGDIKLVAGWRGNAADLPIIEEAAYAKAKAYPEIIYWKLVNEPEQNLTNDAAAMKQLIVALTAAYRGIKRANPNAQVLSIDPGNMRPSYGIPMLDNFLTSGGGAITDIIAIHPYVRQPEDPDLNVDYAALVNMLKQHNYQGDIWFTEGGGHLGIHNPAFALDVHKSLSAEDNGGSWRIGNFSYDIGDGERYAVAYAVRAWLVGLKHGDRIKQQVDWYHGAGTIDYDGTAEARSVALSTLTGILGNAVFVKAQAIREDVNYYLFKDSINRPVGVIWTHGKFEKKTMTIPVSKFGAHVSTFGFINADGSNFVLKKYRNLEISNFPIYLHGKNGRNSNLPLMKIN